MSSLKHLPLLNQRSPPADVKITDVQFIGRLRPTCNNVSVCDPEACKCRLWFGPGDTERRLRHIAENHLCGWLRTCREVTGIFSQMHTAFIAPNTDNVIGERNYL